MIRLATILLTLLLLPGCAALMRSVTGGVADNLSAAILAQDDIATVRDGVPAYLLLLDGLIAGDPENPDLLLAGSRLYGSYGSSFVEEEARAQRMTDRALSYAQRALCSVNRPLCESVERPYDEFTPQLQSIGKGDVDVLYGFGVAWATWIQTHSGDWRAVANLPKVEAVMARVLELDEPHDEGGAHLYMGVLLCQRPASLGGKPEEGRVHFERARELSGGRNLMANVLFAQYYARLVFDRELHDQLLQETVAAEPEAPGFTLSNTVAREQAQELLDGADDYF